MGQSGAGGADWIFLEQVLGSCRCPGPRRCLVSGISRSLYPDHPDHLLRLGGGVVRNAPRPSLYGRPFVCRQSAASVFHPCGARQGSPASLSPWFGGRKGRPCRRKPEPSSPEPPGSGGRGAPAGWCGDGRACAQLRPRAPLGPRGRRRPRSRCSARGPAGEAHLSERRRARGLDGGRTASGPGCGPGLGAPLRSPGPREAFASSLPSLLLCLLEFQQEEAGTSVELLVLLSGRRLGPCTVRGREAGRMWEDHRQGGDRLGLGLAASRDFSGRRRLASRNLSSTATGSHLPSYLLALLWAPPALRPTLTPEGCPREDTV